MQARQPMSNCCMWFKGMALQGLLKTLQTESALMQQDRDILFTMVEVSKTLCSFCLLVNP
jgi:hypothetical protein